MSPWNCQINTTYSPAYGSCNFRGKEHGSTVRMPFLSSTRSFFKTQLKEESFLNIKPTEIFNVSFVPRSPKRLSMARPGSEVTAASANLPEHCRGEFKTCQWQWQLHSLLWRLLPQEGMLGDFFPQSLPQPSPNPSLFNYPRRAGKAGTAGLGL